MPKTPVTSFSVKGDSCQLVVSNLPLNMLSEIVTDLESSELVQYISVSTAGTNQNGQNPGKSPERLVTATMNITLTGGDAQ